MGSTYIFQTIPSNYIFIGVYIYIIVYSDFFRVLDFDFHCAYTAALKNNDEKRTYTCYEYNIRTIGYSSHFEQDNGDGLIEYYRETINRF